MREAVIREKEVPEDKKNAIEATNQERRGKKYETIRIAKEKSNSGSKLHITKTNPPAFSEKKKSEKDEAD